jgi:hypothetical protein
VTLARWRKNIVRRFSGFGRESLEETPANHSVLVRGDFYGGLRFPSSLPTVELVIRGKSRNRRRQNK